jgi:hypothetical protein
MTTDDDPSIIYEPEPTLSQLSGNESEADAATFNAVCWLLRRYSSYTYIARAGALWHSVVAAFDAWPYGAERCSAETLRDWAQTLHSHQAAFERGLALLERGQSAAAYVALAEAVSELEPQDARDERHFSLRLVLEELGPSVAVGGERAGAMALRIQHTLATSWAYESILADRPSLRMRPRRLPDALPAMALPSTAAPAVKTGHKVPHTGIWIPTTIRHGCPNFLIAGNPAPLLTRACERIDYAATPAVGEYPAEPAWSDYEFTTEATDWRLVWADQRYRGEGTNDEPEFLDEDNALP